MTINAELLKENEHLTKQLVATTDLLTGLVEAATEWMKQFNLERESFNCAAWRLIHAAQEANRELGKDD